MERAGQAGGRATLAKHGVEHFRELGRRGFQSFTDRYFQGERDQATEWLRTRAHAKLIDSHVDRELKRRLDKGAEVACMEIPVVEDPDLSWLPF